VEGRVSQIREFQSLAEILYGKRFPSYHEFWKWSTENFPEFWKLWSKESGLIFRREPEAIFIPGENFWDGKWFPGAGINFAENLLQHAVLNPDQIGIHFQPEEGTLPPRYLHNRYIYKEVSNLFHYFRSRGIQKGDRIAAVLPNSPESLIGMLATTALGGIWTSASPDFGVKGILDRFSQIEPKALILCNGYFFKGKEISCLGKWKEILPQIPGLETVILWNFTRPGEATIQKSGEEILIDCDPSRCPELRFWDEIQKETSPPPIEFETLSFQDPVYILYSSGTTGLPKCIVQGPGVLVNHTKELILHCDLRSEESITYYTTCGWMMWNWVASSLFVGSKLCIYDGNPFYPEPEFLWKWIDREKIHVFGTSAKYILSLQQEKVVPKSSYKLDSLRMILSTGSPLPVSGFDYLYESVKSNVHIASISGGTDLNGCFALGNPDLPVHKGELQCRGLGMAVAIYNEFGQSVLKEKGELVCEKPFPSMPLCFWKDTAGEKYREAYFSRFPQVWCHGDYAEITEHEGLIIYGRSDTTLNPGGVRIGTADIYGVLESIPEIRDSVVVGQSWKEDVRVILFVVLQENIGRSSDPYKLDPQWEERIRKLIRESISPRHVPSLIFRVKEVPYTVNGKKVELAVKNITESKAVKNSNALANPECLEEYFEITKKFLVEDTLDSNFRSL